MNLTEKEISYTTTNTYATLNTLTPETKNIWLVFHGMGYLSRYFLKYFEVMNIKENYFIAPQAPSKYYIGPKFRHVGASWLTKENTKKETMNLMNYIDGVLEKENIPHNRNLIIMGYSQGVSIAMRYMAYRKLQADRLIIHSGGIPTELNPDDFEYFKGKATLVYGNEDEYLNEERKEQEIEKGTLLFGITLDVIPFNGKHVVNTEIIKNIISTM